MNDTKALVEKLGEELKAEFARLHLEKARLTQQNAALFEEKAGYRKESEQRGEEIKRLQKMMSLEDHRSLQTALASAEVANSNLAQQLGMEQAACRSFAEQVRHLKAERLRLYQQRDSENAANAVLREQIAKKAYSDALITEQRESINNQDRELNGLRQMFKQSQKDLAEARRTIDDVYALIDEAKRLAGDL